MTEPRIASVFGLISIRSVWNPSELRIEDSFMTDRLAIFSTLPRACIATFSREELAPVLFAEWPR